MSQATKPDQQLHRSLGLLSALALTVSVVIGSGIYKKVAPMAAELLSPELVMVCWVLAGIITLCGALSNAEIAGMFADSGGEIVYYKKIYGNFFSFLFGWASLIVIRSSAIASIAYVFSESVNALIGIPPLFSGWSEVSVFGIFTPFENFGVKSVTIGLILVLSYINFRGISLGAGVSTIITLTVLTGILFIIVFGFSSGKGSFSNLYTNSADFTSSSIFSGRFISSLFAALLAAFWAYDGWNSVGFIGAEIKNANRNLPLALTGGVAFVILVYVCVNLTYLYIFPIDQFVAINNSQNTIAGAVVVQHFLGEGGAVFIILLISITTLGSTNTTILTSPRLYYAMAKDGMFFKSVAYIHPRFGTPAMAILIQAIWASILVLSGSFNQLTDMLVFASFIFYGATALGVFILRIRMPDAPRPYKAWGYPIIPGLFILFCVALIIITIIGKPREALLGLGLILTGVPFYWLTKKSKS